MKLNYKKILTVALLAFGAPAVASAQDACFYEHAGYGGRSMCLYEGQTLINLADNGFNDQISSLQIARGLVARLCQHAYFQGECRDFRGNELNFANIGFNDTVSSISLERDGGWGPPGGGGGWNPPPGGGGGGWDPPPGGGGGGWNPPPGGGWGAQVCFYEHAYYQGRSFCTGRNTRYDNLVNTAFQDSISSIRVSGRARVTVCKHAYFGSPCGTTEQSVDNLVNTEFQDSISSIQVD